MARPEIEPFDDQDPGLEDAPQSPRRWMLLTTLLAALILLVNLYPFDFQPRGGGRGLELRPGMARTLVLSMSLFTAFGYFEAKLARAMFIRWFSGRWVDRVVILVLIDVVLLSLLAEAAQLWLPDRQSSVFDLLCHTLCGTLGGIVGVLPAQRARP